MSIYEPIIVDPPGMTPESGWAECDAAVKGAGGLQDRDGEVNLRAAFSADPGITSCPKCRAQHWAWGRRVRCSQCAFEFPTDWWPMYSYGVNAATGAARGAKIHIGNHDGLRSLHETRLSHAYYRYGFQHPVASAWDEHEKIDWANVLQRAADPSKRGDR